MVAEAFGHLVERYGSRHHDQLRRVIESGGVGPLVQVAEIYPAGSWAFDDHQEVAGLASPGSASTSSSQIGQYSGGRASFSAWEGLPGSRCQNTSLDVPG